MKQKKKIRLSDIAKQLNISTVTVSKALSNKDGVGEELRTQIKNLASTMGYLGKKEDTQEKPAFTGNIGILIPSRYFTIDNSFYWYIFNELSKEFLKKKIYCIMELLSEEDEQNKKLPGVLTDKKVEGLLILGQVSQTYTEMIHSIYDNFILLDFYTQNPNIDSVSTDNFYCSYLLTKYVISKGHKSICYVGNFNATSSIKDRYMGYLKAMIENHLPIDFNNVISDRRDDSSIIDFSLPDDFKKYTAFVCNCDETAAKLISLLQEKGIKVPQDVSVTGFDDYLSPTTKTIPLTTVAINVKDLVGASVALLINKICNIPFSKGRHVISGTIIERDSVKQI